MRFMTISLLLAAIAAASLSARQEQPATADTTQNKEFDVKQRQQDVKMFLDKIEILGKIDKPQTVFIVPGQDSNVDDIQIDRAFYPEIFRNVEWDSIKKVVEKQARRKKQ